MSNQALAEISRIIIDERQPPQALQRALDDYSRLCSQATGIMPDPGFTKWADDTFLAEGVAINPQSAAYCLKDYQRSINYIRGIYAAILDLKRRTPADPVNILYAGCGPFATLILPLLVNFRATELNLFLLDIHQASLDSVRKLMTFFALDSHRITLIKGDACRYRHPQTLQLIVAEVMQKALEQEPQFAVTVNLASQLSDGGIFIPQAIHIALCLGHWKEEKKACLEGKAFFTEHLYSSHLRHLVADILSLTPTNAAALHKQASYSETSGKYEINIGRVCIPDIDRLTTFDALLTTRIEVYRQYTLNDYASNITLPHKCYELSPLRAGTCFRVCYQLGSYPKFEFTPENSLQD